MGDVRVVHTHPEWFAEPNHGFAWIRMIGALAVIYGHSSPLAGTGDLFPADWPVQPDEGVLMGFFAMSGFQITESWIRDPHPFRFAAKRILRLWPPMLTVSLTMALIIGPMITTLSVGDYFAANGTWGYVVNNAGLLTLRHELPGVFVNNPWPNAVNGSLWTLPMELLAYAALYALLLLGAGKHKYRWLAVVALIGIITWDRYLEELPGSESAGSFLSVPVESLVAFLVAFAFGVVLNLYRVPLSPLAAGGGLVLLVLMPNSITGSFWMTFAVSYAVVVTGHFWPSRLTVPGVWVNGSYGVYVWSFPIQQLLAMAGIRNQWLMLICAAPLAYCVGTLSWKFIEEPTMKLRHYLTPASKKKEPERAEDGLDEPEDLDDSEDPDDFDDLEPEDRDERDDDRAARLDDPDEPRAARRATTMRRPPPRPPAPNRDGAAQEPPTKLTPVRPGADQTRPPRPLRRATTPPNGAPVDHNRVNGVPRHGSADGPNAARLNGLPMNGTGPPLGRPSARSRRSAEQWAVGPPAVPPEDSVLSKRLSGDLDFDRTPVDRQAVRRTGGRHARPEPPPTPEEETRPVRPKRQDRP
ncbi:acyltransferase [Saccharopolyspora sp. ASAGF58]|uniref:acyltransferase family protein n=1 Tax=Saccharopolyspora sp. ASAGF58 TaxID=2719023 RepID=UPI001FF0BE24|nr:acyltransferase [Saccharopolyspora sp. ASAGF58]